MKSALFIAALLVGLASANFFPSLSSPVVFWSGQSYFSNSQSLETTYTRQIDQTMAKLCGAQDNEHSIQKAFGSFEDAPELVILWLEPQLETTEFSMRVGAYDNQKSDAGDAPVKAVLKSASSTFIAPYTYGVADTVTFDETISHVKSTGGEVIYAGSSDSMSTSEVLNFLKSSDILSNGKVDMIIVRADAPQIVEVFSAVDEYVKRGTHGKYVGLYGTERIASVMPEETIRGPYPYKEYWPRSLWEGLFVTVGLGAILIIAIAMMYVIRSPPRFSSELELLKPEALRER